MKKVETEIKNILIKNVDEEEAQEMLKNIMDKIGSIKLCKTSPRKKDKNAPKNAQNAYMFFCNTNRAKFKDENPEMKATTIVQQMSKMWRELSEEEKGPYNKMAEKDKLRYTKAMEAYKKESSSDDEKKEVKSKNSSKVPPEKKAPVKKVKEEKEKKTSTKKKADEFKSKSKTESKTKTTIPKNPPVVAIRDEEDDEDLEDEEPTEE